MFPLPLPYPIQLLESDVNTFTTTDVHLIILVMPARNHLTSILIRNLTPVFPLEPIFEVSIS